MVYAVKGREFRDTETSMLINPLIFHVNVGRKTSGLRTALPDLSATEITGQVASYVARLPMPYTDVSPGADPKPSS
jgi:hypothetical protein